MATPPEMFERVLACCGFSSVLGPGILRRALSDEGVTEETATAADYKRALPRIEARMTVYLPPNEVARRSRRVIGYLAFADGELDFDDEREFSRIGHTYQELKARAEAEARTSEPPARQASGVPEARASEPAIRSTSGVMERAEVSEATRARAREASEKR